MQTPVQVTVVEYVAEFFRQYKSRAYGKSIIVNAKGGAEALMGMLKLVLSKGGREELRIALHCFKDQLALALNSGHLRQQQLEELFALLSSLIDAAERLRQFSPVKESFSSAVLEEVRWRLFRIVAGDGFSEAAGIRRRALDIIFQSMQREQQQQQKSLVRQQQLAAAGGGASSRSSSSDLTNVSPSKARVRGSFQRKVAGPDVSSWEGLWNSLPAMSGKRMLPLLQSVLQDLYSGKQVPGSAAAAPAAASNKASIASQKQQQQQLPVQQQANGCSNVTAAPTAARTGAASAPSRSDTAISIDIAAAGSCSGLPNCTAADAALDGTSKPVARAEAATSGGACCAVPSSNCGVDTPPRQHSDGHETAAVDQQLYGRAGVAYGSEAALLHHADHGLHANALAAAAAAAASAAGGGGLDLKAMTEALQHSPIRISCGGSSIATDGHGASPAAAAAMQDGSSQPDTPTSTAASSSCLGSPTAAAKRGGTGIVAKIRASVGGSSGSSSMGGPAGWIPKGWVQFHPRDKSGGGMTSFATDADSSNGGGGARAQYSLADVADQRVGGGVDSAGQQQSHYEAEEMPTAVAGTAAAGAFAGEDVDWGSSVAGSATAPPAAVKV